MILSIETATEVCGVALVDNNEVAGQRIRVEKNIHSECLMPMIDDLLREAAVNPHEIHSVAVSIGPGSFTGLRIGLSTAKGLACGWGKTLISVSTLDALAEEFIRSGNFRGSVVFCAAIDAKRDEAFTAIFRITEGRAFQLEAPVLESAAATLKRLEGYDSVVIGGDGAKKIAALGGSRQTMKLEENIFPHPVAVALASRNSRRLSLQEFLMLEPTYLREFTAVSGRQSRISRPPHVAGTEPIINQ